MRYRNLVMLWLLSMMLCPAASRASVVSGAQAFLTVRTSDTLDIVAGADVSFIDAYDESQVNISGGNVSHLNLYDNSAAFVNGGDISFIRAYDDSTVRLTYAENLSWLLVGSGSKVELVASEVSYSAGHVNGLWADGAPFSFWAIPLDLQSPTFPGYTSIPSNIVITPVPVPGALLLLASSLGLLLFPNRLAGGDAKHLVAGGP